MCGPKIQQRLFTLQVHKLVKVFRCEMREEKASMQELKGRLKELDHYTGKFITAWEVCKRTHDYARQLE